MKISRFGAGMSIALSDAEKARLSHEFQRVHYPDDVQYGEYVGLARQAFVRAIGQGVLDVIRQNFDSERPVPFVRIENVPVDPVVPPTPLPGERVVKATSYSENILVAVGEGMGGYCYGQQAEEAQLVNQIIPQGNREDTGLGYLLELKYHIENAALRHFLGSDRAPRALALTAVRVALSAAPATRVADGLLAEERLEDRRRRVLREKRFKIRLPYRWDSMMPEDRRWTHPMAVIEGTGGATRICAAFYGGLMQGLDEEAADALRAYEAALEACGDRVSVTCGTVLLICNDIAFHSRDAFDPQFRSGRAGRWLQRIFVARDLSAFKGWETQSDRIFCPR